MRTPILLTLLAVPVLTAFAFEAAVPASPPTADEPFAVATSRTFERTLEFDGVFVPAEATELVIWPEAFSGELLVLEMLAHGSYVSEGEVIARLDTRPLTEQIESAARGLHSAKIAHDATAGRAHLAALAAEETMKLSELEVARARRSLEGYLEHELDFRRRSTDAGLRAYKHSVQDAKDELEQLEAMYREDDLFAATEEIVLRRNRRALHEAELGMKLQEERTAFTRELSLPVEIERRREKLAKQESAHQRLVHQQKLEAASREDGVVVSEAGLHEKHRRLERLRHDLELLVVRAPRTGVLVHGGLKENGPGRAHAEHRQGSRLTPRAAFATIADTGELAVAFSIGESQVAEVQSGTAATVKPVVSKKVELVGVTRIERYPTPSSAAGAENRYEAKVVLDKSRPGILFGMRAKLSLQLEQIPDAVIVPKGAVFGEGADARCWAAKGENAPFAEVPVELGLSKNGEVVITKGIEAGWLVLLVQPGS